MSSGEEIINILNSTTVTAQILEYLLRKHKYAYYISPEGIYLLNMLLKILKILNSSGPLSLQ